MADSKVFSGCRGILKKDGVTKGWATGVSGSLELQQAPIEVLGTVDVTEYVTTGRRVSGRMDYVRIVDEDLASQNLVPNGAGTVADVINFPGMTLQVEDTLTGKVMYQLEGVKVTSSGWSVSARGVVGTDCSFVALKMKFGSELG